MILGFDASSCQSSIDFQSLFVSGNVFCYLRACDGTSLDTSYYNYQLQAFRASIHTGSYAIGHPSQDAKALAAYFCKVMARTPIADTLPPVVDMETTYDGHTVPSNAGQWANDYLEYLKDYTSITNPMVYASTSYYNAMVQQCPDLAGWDWWCAEYHSDQTPNTLPRTQYPITLWQYAGDIKVAGIEPLADLDMVPDGQPLPFIQRAS